MQWRRHLCMEVLRLKHRIYGMACGMRLVSEHSTRKLWVFGGEKSLLVVTAHRQPCASTNTLELSFVPLRTLRGLVGFLSALPSHCLVSSPATTSCVRSCRTELIVHSPSLLKRFRSVNRRRNGPIRTSRIPSTPLRRPKLRFQRSIEAVS